LFLANCKKSVKKPLAPVATGNGEIRAVSLNGLQQRLKACIPKSSCQQELLQLAGIKKMMGVIADEQNHDLVLFGQTDSSLPPLQLEDLVVALRNAWLLYAPLKDNVYQYSDPGCSIDPNPAIVHELQRIGNFKVSPSGDATQSIDNWNHVCEGPQAVRVLGIPFDTHFAQVMVKADYDMKRLVDGSDALDIPGLVSITDREVEKAQNEIDQRQPVSLAGPSLNRFWFYPGANIYEESEGIILIKQCPVKLLTEQMYSNRGEQLAGSGDVDPLANEFADGLTVLYEKVAQARPIYAELAALFRFAAVAKIMKSRYADAGFDLSYLLERYPVATTSVDKSLPGRHTVKQIHREDSANGYRQLNLWFPSCGGVDIGIEANAANFKNVSNEKLLGFKQGILGSRLSRDTPYWVFTKATAESTAALAYNSRIAEVNQANLESRLFTVVISVEGRSFKYQLNDGDRLEQFANVSDLMESVNAKLAGDARKIVYFDVDGIANGEKLEAFASSCRIQQAKRNKEIEIITLSRPNGSPEAQDAFFSRGIRFDGPASTVEEVAEGAHKGRFRAVLKFFTSVGGTVKRVVVSVLCNTRAQAEALLNAFRLQSLTPRFRLSSTSDVINQIRTLLKEGDRPELSDINLAKLIVPSELETA
jgi:hypothetical protein